MHLLHLPEPLPLWDHFCDRSLSRSAFLSTDFCGLSSVFPQYIKKKNDCNSSSISCKSSGSKYHREKCVDLNRTHWSERRVRGERSSRNAKTKTSSVGTSFPALAVALPHALLFLPALYHNPLFLGEACPPLRHSGWGKDVRFQDLSPPVTGISGFVRFPQSRVCVWFKFLLQDGENWKDRSACVETSCQCGPCQLWSGWEPGTSACCPGTAPSVLAVSQDLAETGKRV